MMSWKPGEEAGVDVDVGRVRWVRRGTEKLMRGR